MNLEPSRLMAQALKTWEKSLPWDNLGGFIRTVNRTCIINEAVGFQNRCIFKLIRIMLYVEFLRLFLGRHDER